MGFKESKIYFYEKKRLFFHAVRSMIDFALIRNTTLVNWNVIWQSNGEKKTDLPIILRKHATYLKKDNSGKCFETLKTGNNLEVIQRTKY